MISAKETDILSMNVPVVGGICFVCLMIHTHQELVSAYIRLVVLEHERLQLIIGGI